MQNFTYRSTQEKDNIEAVLRQRKRKFNTQQWVARIILFVIIGSLLLYVTNHVYYTELDGYVSVDANKVRSPFDIYLDSVYVKTGDMLAPGDTMYSYYIIDMLIENSNPNKEPAIIASNRDIKLRYQSAARDVSVLRVQINELKKQIEVESHNISFGLSSNSHKMDLERQLNEANAKLRALLNELYTLGKMRAETTPNPDYLNVGDGRSRYGQQIYDDYNADVFRAAVNYHLSSDSSIVTDVVAPNRMIFFKKEDILTTQHIDLEGNNLSIMAYVPVEKMKHVKDSSKAKVIINDKYEYTATVAALGLRTAVIPENLRSYFAKKNTALVAMLKIDEGQTVPFWCMAEGLPVSVRIKNMDTWKVDLHKRYRLWYTTGKGIIFGQPDSTANANAMDISSASHPAESDSTTAASADSTSTVAESQPSVASTSGSATSSANVKDTATPVNTAHKEITAQNSKGKAEKKQDSVEKTAPAVQEKNNTTSQTANTEANIINKPIAETSATEVRKDYKPKIQNAPDCRYYAFAGTFAEYEAAESQLRRYVDKYPQAGILKNGRSWQVYVAKADLREIIVKRARAISTDIGRLVVYDTMTGNNLDY